MQKIGFDADGWELVEWWGEKPGVGPGQAILQSIDIQSVHIMLQASME